MTSASDTKRLLSDFSLTPNKALGQNFLCDERAVQSILDVAGIDGATVLEIGPGLGALTLPLSARAKKLVAVEIDAALFKALQTLLKDAQSTTLLHADFLKLDPSALLREQLGGPFSVVANLPYYVTTPICMELLSADLPISSMTLMLQKEAAERFFALPSNRVYGPLTVLAQQYFTVKKALSLSPASYYPSPEVDSVVLHLARKEGIAFLPALPQLLKAAFSMRRKTLANNLKPLFPTREALLAALTECGIDPSARAETLTHEEFYRLGNSSFLERKEPKELLPKLK